MIAAFAARKGRTLINENFRGSKLLILPDEKEIIFDGEMGMLMLNGCVRCDSYRN